MIYRGSYQKNPVAVKYCGQNISKIVCRGKTVWEGGHYAVVENNTVNVHSGKFLGAENDIDSNLFIRAKELTVRLNDGSLKRASDLSSSAGNCSLVSGLLSQQSGAPHRYGFAVSNGTLCSVLLTDTGSSNGKTLSVRSISSGSWTAITGSYYNNDYFGYGIRNGQLYRLTYSDIAQIGTSAGWTKIKCYGNTAFGICSGGLYRISGETAEQFGTGSGWTDFCLSPDTVHTVFGIHNGQLCGVLNGLTSVINGDTDWTKIAGSYNSSYAYIPAIKGGALYLVRQPSSSISGNITLLDATGTWTDCSGDSNGGMLGIRNGTVCRVTTNGYTSLDNTYTWQKIYANKFVAT